MNIADFAKLGNVTISVTPADLREFASLIISEFKDEQAAEARKQERDRRNGVPTLTADEVCTRLGITACTLWRWRQSGYLRPAGYVGRSPRYSEQQLEQLAKGK